MKRRIILDYDEEGIVNIARIKSYLGVTSSPQLFRIALTFLDYALTKKSDGYTLQFVKDGKVIEFVIIGGFK